MNTDVEIPASRLELQGLDHFELVEVSILFCLVMISESLIHEQFKSIIDKHRVSGIDFPITSRSQRFPTESYQVMSLSF